MTPKQFALAIEKIASQKKITHMEAVLEYCKEKEIEPEHSGIANGQAYRFQ